MGKKRYIGSYGLPLVFTEVMRKGQREILGAVEEEPIKEKVNLDDC